MMGLCLRAVLMVVEREMELIRERLEHPEWFAARLDDGPLAIWASKTAKMEIAELALGIYLSRVLRTPDGMLMEYGDVMKLAERVFGVKLTNHRELKRDLFKRANGMVFLERLMFLIERARDEKDA